MMNLSHAIELVKHIQTTYHKQLGIPLPEVDQNTSWMESDFEEYFEANPDNNREESLAHAKEMAADSSKIERPDISIYNSKNGSSILLNRVDELKLALSQLEEPIEVNNVCFGTIPGGGLNAFVQKVDGYDEFAVIIPDGLFHLINLFTKVIILLQPIKQTKEGAVYLPSASYEQQSLASNPYVKFRIEDLLKSYFIHGNPTRSLPYRKAIPFQDRFAYILVGTEIYVLAHEIAHIVLGHFNNNKNLADKEVEADNFAFDVLVQFYKIKGFNYAEARASVCAVLFFSINKLWENVIEFFIRKDINNTTNKFKESAQEYFSQLFTRDLATDEESIKFDYHPTALSRFQSFTTKLRKLTQIETPPWYIHVSNAILIATRILPNQFFSIFFQDKNITDLNARVLPFQFMGYGSLVSIPVPHVWVKTLAGLVLSKEKHKRRLGLWFISELFPESAMVFYLELLAEDESISELCETVLISLQPMYRSYLPRLKERFRETKKDDQFYEYILQISQMLMMQVYIELGEDRLQSGPMANKFYS